jgi:hypothetical protein
VARSWERAAAGPPEGLSWTGLGFAGAGGPRLPQWMPIRPAIFERKVSIFGSPTLR